MVFDPVILAVRSRMRIISPARPPRMPLVSGWSTTDFAISDIVLSNSPCSSGFGPLGRRVPCCRSPASSMHAGRTRLIYAMRPPPPAAPCRTCPPRRGPRASGAGRDRRPAAAGGMWRFGGPAAPHAARSAPGSSLAASPCAARPSSLRPSPGRAAPRSLCLPALLGSAPAASPCAAMPSASRSGSGCCSGSELAHPRRPVGPCRFSGMCHGIRRGIRAPAVLGRPAVVAAAAGCRAVHACGQGGRDLCPRRAGCWMLARGLRRRRTGRHASRSAVAQAARFQGAHFRRRRRRRPRRGGAQCENTAPAAGLHRRCGGNGGGGGGGRPGEGAT